MSQGNAMEAAHYIGDRTLTIDTCQPRTPAGGEVRLQVAYCSVCDTHLHVSSSRSLGFEAVDPRAVDLAQFVREHSGDSGANVVFEVSGAKAAILSATELLRIRGRLLLVAIHPQLAEINLFHFFWKELRLQGARVYEHAIERLAGGALPLPRMISAVLPLRDIVKAFTTLESDPEGNKDPDGLRRRRADCVGGLKRHSAGGRER